MPLEISVGPPQLAITVGYENQGWKDAGDALVNVADRQAQGRHVFDGLPVEARHLLVAGRQLEHAFLPGAHALPGRRLVRPLDAGVGTLKAVSSIRQVVAKAGMPTRRPTAFAPDFPAIRLRKPELEARTWRDIFEVKAKNIVRRGSVTTRWSAARGELKTSYRNRDFSRGVTACVCANDSKPLSARGKAILKLSRPLRC